MERLRHRALPSQPESTCGCHEERNIWYCPECQQRFNVQTIQYRQCQTARFRRRRLCDGAVPQDRFPLASEPCPQCQRNNTNPQAVTTNQHQQATQFEELDGRPFMPRFGDPFTGRQAEDRNQRFEVPQPAIQCCYHDLMDDDGFTLADRDYRLAWHLAGEEFGHDPELVYSTQQQLMYSTQQQPMQTAKGRGPQPTDEQASEDEQRAFKSILGFFLDALTPIEVQRAPRTIVDIRGPFGILRKRSERGPGYEVTNILFRPRGEVVRRDLLEGLVCERPRRR